MSNKEQYTVLLIILGIIVGGAVYIFSPRDVGEKMLGAFSDPFISRQLSTTTATSGYCLTTNGTGNVWSACGAGGGALADWQQVNGALTPTTTIGIRVNASSTIGDGTSGGGLTVFGQATTTGGLYDTSGYITSIGTTPYFDLNETDTNKYGGVYMAAGDLHLYTDAANLIQLDNNLKLVSGGTFYTNGGYVSGNIVPSTHDTYDLGATGAGWAGLWLGQDECINFDSVECVIGQTVTGSDIEIQPNGINTTGRVSIGSSTPSAKLSVQGWTTDLASQDLLRIASSSKTTYFNVTGTGAIGLSSTTPSAQLSIKGALTALVQIFTSTGTKILEILDSGAVAILGAWDAGGATSFEIPNSSNPTLDAIGEIAVNTASSTFEFATSTNGYPAIIAPYNVIRFNMASSSWTATGTAQYVTLDMREYVRSGMCYTDAGTLLVRVGDGTNWSNAVSISTATTSIAFTSNNSFVGGGTKIIFQIGTPASSPTLVTCSFRSFYQR